jgi:hypothetical protein
MKTPPLALATVRSSKEPGIARGRHETLGPAKLAATQQHSLPPQKLAPAAAAAAAAAASLQPVPASFRRRRRRRRHGLRSTAPHERGYLRQAEARHGGRPPRRRLRWVVFGRAWQILLATS